jgi:hypothetical protein
MVGIALFFRVAIQKRRTMGIRIYCFSIIIAIVLAAQVFAQGLYKTSTKEMGVTAFDHTITEIERADHLLSSPYPWFS